MQLEAQVQTATLAMHAQRRWLFGLLVTLNLLDVVTTELVLQAGGVETNPIMQPVVHSVPMVILIKVVALGAAGMLLARARPSLPVDVALTLVTGWYTAVIVWNVLVYFAV
ncbi:MAG: DUF5658 family protein [Actinomycetota bacterium]